MFLKIGNVSYRALDQATIVIKCVVYFIYLSYKKKADVFGEILRWSSADLFQPFLDAVWRELFPSSEDFLYGTHIGPGIYNMD